MRRTTLLRGGFNRPTLGQQIATTTSSFGGQSCSPGWVVLDVTAFVQRSRPPRRA